MRKLLTKYGLAIVSGVLLSFAFPVFHFYPLAWIALAPLFFRCRKATPSQGALQFFVAGWVFHTILLQWLATNIYWAGGWAIVGQQCMCVALSVYWAVFGALWSAIRRRTPRLANAATAAVLWAAMEQLQGTWFTGFGWGALAYSQGPDLALLQWAVIGSTPIIAAIIISVNVLCVELVTRKGGRVVAALVIIAVLGVAHAVGYLLLAEPTHATDPLKVGVLQSNFPLEMKWDQEYTEEMVRSAAQKSLALATREGTDLIIWPEALVMDTLERPTILRHIFSLVKEGETALFTGAVRSERKPYRGYNSSFLIEKDGRVAGHYDKMHLAPFGEYIPYVEYLPFVKKIVPTIGGVSPGNEAKVFSVRDRDLGPLICFEVLFPGMSNDLREAGADFLVVVTNLAWFGRSNALVQELEIARLRAIETRLPLVQSANTGISGMFDPWGRFTPLQMGSGSGASMYRMPESIRPSQTIRMRMVGAFDLPDAAPIPIAHASTILPWLFVLGAALILVLGAVLGRKTDMKG